MPLPDDEAKKIGEDAYDNVTKNNKGEGTVKKLSYFIQDATEAIMSMIKFITLEETDDILYYHKGVYNKGGEILIAKKLEAQFGYELNDHSLTTVLGHIRRRTYHKHEELDKDINIINLKNGLYDIENDELKPHTSAYLSIKQKPITFNRESKPARFTDFINEVVFKQDVQTAIDVLAYTFRRDYDIEVIVKLYGLGNNGKTVFTSLATALHGPENVSNVPMNVLIGNTFGLSGLKDKDINIDNELGRQTITESAVLKRLTGGSRQRIRIEEKNKPAYDAIIYAKLIFNVNVMPDSVDKSDAYNRRMVILSFPYQFDGTEGRIDDKKLTAKLTTEEEKSAIFNILMVALRRIIKDKELYVNEKTTEERRAKYERAVNPWKSFFRDAVFEYSLADDVTTKADLHKAYIQYCNQYAIPHEKYDQFCANIRRQIVGLGEKRIGSDGGRIHCWAGVRLLPEYGGPELEQSRLNLDDSYGT